MQRVVHAAVIAFMVIAMNAGVARAQATHHTLFRVSGSGGATVYLLGSVHLLSPEAGKLAPVIDSAFAHAKVIAFETSLDSIMARAPELLARAQYPPGTTLRSSLSAAAAARLDTIVQAYGLTLDQLNGFKPWFVSMALSQLAMQHAGFTADYGVDVQLDQRAHTAGKTIVGLEPVDVQLGLFDALSPADQARLVLEAQPPDSAALELEQIKDAWLVGDVARLDSIVNKPSPGSERLFDVLVTRRNAAWLPKIEALVAGHDDALVVVGAAHLVGVHGLVAMLRAKGYRVEQL